MCYKRIVAKHEITPFTVCSTLSVECVYVRNRKCSIERIQSLTNNTDAGVDVFEVTKKQQKIQMVAQCQTDK